jgi:hypothetical protein
VVQYLQAYIEGLRWTLDPKNQEAAIAMLAERLKLPPDIAAECYALITDGKRGLARDGKFNMEGFRNVLRLRSKFEGPTRPAEAYVDFSYYKKALAGL